MCNVPVEKVLVTMHKCGIYWELYLTAFLGTTSSALTPQLGTTCPIPVELVLLTIHILWVQCYIAPLIVLAGWPLRGRDVEVNVFDVNQPSLPSPFYSVLVSVSVFIAPSTVFQSINSPDNSPPSHSVLSVLFLPYWSFQQYICLWKSPSALI